LKRRNLKKRKILIISIIYDNLIVLIEFLTRPNRILEILTAAAEIKESIMEWLSLNKQMPEVIPTDIF
jgi:hypothetical protein